MTWNPPKYQIQRDVYKIAAKTSHLKREHNPQPRILPDWGDQEQESVWRDVLPNFSSPVLIISSYGRKPSSNSLGEIDVGVPMFSSPCAEPIEKIDTPP